jgi:hypothetical protein
MAVSINWRRVGAVLLGVAICIYLFMPVLAGLLGAGDRRGPVFYPEWLHSGLYAVAYEVSFGENARVYHKAPPRPWFYPMNTDAWYINHENR